MTHTLHRRGSKSDLAHDYVVLAMAARGVNRDGAAPKLARALEIFAAHNPVNFGTWPEIPSRGRCPKWSLLRVTTQSLTPFSGILRMSQQCSRT